MKRKTYEFIDDDEWLIQKYSIEKMSIHKISLIEECTEKPIKRRLQILGIHTRNLHEAMNGIKFTEKHKQNIGNANRGKIRSDETKQHLSKIRIERGLAKLNKNPMYGKHHTDETKTKISRMLVGRKRTVPIWNKGIKNPYSEETLLKMSESQSERHKFENISKEKFDKYTKTTKNRVIKPLLVKRDKCCQMCGDIFKSKSRFCVHHIYENDSYDLDDLMLLCDDCHRAITPLTHWYLLHNLDPLEIFYNIWAR